MPSFVCNEWMDGWKNIHVYLKRNRKEEPLELKDLIDGKKYFNVGDNVIVSFFDATEYVIITDVENLSWKTLTLLEY